MFRQGMFRTDRVKNINIRFYNIGIKISGIIFILLANNEVQPSRRTSVTLQEALDVRARIHLVAIAASDEEAADLTQPTKVNRITTLAGTLAANGQGGYKIIPISIQKHIENF